MYSNGLSSIPESQALLASFYYRIVHSGYEKHPKKYRMALITSTAFRLLYSDTLSKYKFL